MDSQRALELIDAHLDGERLSEEDAAALNDWIKGNSDQADLAFRRIFLHSYLRKRIQTASLLPRGHSAETLLPSEPRSSVAGDADGNPGTMAGWVRATVGGLLVTATVVGAYLWIGSTSVPAIPESAPFVYEPFDYPGYDYPGFDNHQFEIWIPDGLWPTEGGLSGADGGIGFATPWEETGTLVAVVEADPPRHTAGKADMRQFGRLGFVDPSGNELKTQGNQLRTSAGPHSDTLRAINFAAVPQSLREGDTLGADGGTLWIGVLMQSFDGLGEFRYAFLQVGSQESGMRIGKLQSAPSGHWSVCGVIDDAEVNVRVSDKPSGESVFFVARIRFQPGPEEVTVWINPPLAATPAEERASMRLQLPDIRVDTIRIASRYSTDFDEIRLGETFRDVAPMAPQQIGSE
ncbi:MAG: hypothetical protein WD045_12860 [Pirellulaceae bacterium]